MRGYCQLATRLHNNGETKPFLLRFAYCLFSFFPPSKYRLEYKRKVIGLTKKKPYDLIVRFYLNFIMRFPRIGFKGRVASCK
jgi:hypothetical protein